MFSNSTVKLSLITTSIYNSSKDLIQLNISSNIQLIRYIFHIIILIIFIFILAFIGHKNNYSRILIRPFSYLSYIIVSIGIVSLILNDLLVINGITHQIICSIHQIFLHLLLIIIILGRLLPDIYEYINQYYYQKYDTGTLKFSIILSFIILLCIQLLISIKFLWNNDNNFLNNKFNLPIFCSNYIRPQIIIFILHLFEFIIIIQSIRTPIILDDINSISSIIIYINEKFFQLNSILLRLFYFISTLILHILFFPGQFSGTFYSGIIIIDFILKYLIIIYHSNVRYERNIANIDNMNGMLNTAYIRLKNDDLNDDMRLLNNID